MHQPMRLPARAALATSTAALLLAIAGCIDPPERAPITQSVWIEQGWTAAQRSWFHHASQGTGTLPVTYDWLLALEQPVLGLGGEPPRFADPAYLRRWGFIDSPKSAGNPGGLPVGFALTEDFKDPVTGRSKRAVGFTCAACHTGQLTYQGTQLLVDGGPAMSNVTKMGEALGLAMVLTKWVPGRFDRFARRVLGDRYNDASVAALKEEFDLALAFVKRQKALMDKTKDGSIEEGFSRLDALTRIGNTVFGIAANKDVNFAPVGAPVSYPPIWNTSWFSWVQYDGSIMQPMVRNAGEALGVVAGINLAGPAETRFQTTARLQTLHEMETQLAGTRPPLPNKAFDGLQSPKWPEQVLGTIDRSKAAAGKALYQQHCQGCHLPPVDSPEFWDDQHWITLGGSQQRYLNVKYIDLGEIGTDPAEAHALDRRTIDTSGIGVNATLWLPDAQTGACKPMDKPTTDGTAVPFGLALGAVVQQTVERWYAQNNTPEALRAQMNGDRPNCLNPAEAYRARPLNGVWATPPFLHNGSVPSLQALLSPVSERPAVFWLGQLEFDPKSVGLVVTEIKNGNKLDTSVPGNSNKGHEFADAPKGTPGVIGPLLKPEERAALIEYLKSI